MEQINQIATQVGKALGVENSQIALEYILTEQEEQEAIHYAIKSIKGKLTARFAAVGKDLSTIVWDDFIDKQELLARCNRNKHYSLEERKDRETEAAARKATNEAKITLWNANHFFKYLKAQAIQELLDKGKEPIFYQTGENMRLIKIWCYFLSKDPRFETELGFTFSKGLMFRGGCGLGKTFIPYCLRNNDLAPIRVLSMLDISDEVKHKGACEIAPGGNLYLDDVGTEPNMINYYGTKVYWFKDFFESYYMKSDYSKLMISTNNSFDEIEEKYGFRVRDRIKEVFNVITIKGESLRK